MSNVERLTLAMHDRLGLFLMDRIPWINKSKPPGPTYWACAQKKHLSAAWEPILWFSNDPANIRADNQSVLIPHSEPHKKLMSEGGEKRETQYGDGAYRIRHGSFANQTKGKIHRNLIELGHNCADTRAVRREARELGLPPHPAMFPTALPEFFVKYLTEEGDLVVDPFAGAFKTCIAAERNNRRWIGTEKILEYIVQARFLFANPNSTSALSNT